MGFPSPADDHSDLPLNLHDYLIPHPAATFFWRYSGSEMDREGIQTDALVVIDRSLLARPGDVVAAIHNGEPVVRLLVQHGNTFQLHTAPLTGSPSICTVSTETIIWGVVTHVVNHKKAGALNTARYGDIADGQG